VSLRAEAPGPPNAALKDMSSVAVNAMEAMLAGAIDYAGLFPPATLPMADAVANYAGYLTGQEAWALGRFIVPATRLDEFGVALATHAGMEPWRLSVLVGANLAADLATVVSFNQRWGSALERRSPKPLVPGSHGGLASASGATPTAVIDTLELKAPTPDSIAEAAELTGGEFAVFHEIPLANDTPALLATLARAGARAKIRTGGVTADAFPGASALAGFLEQCAAARVSFKATAGLHHPLRGTHALTYESGSAKATMHGFVNVFLASAFAWAGWTAGQLVELLTETSPAAFAFNPEGASWRGHALGADALRAARTQFLLSFGSCSFEEPINDLQSLGWL
jgi:hypothetical protein